MKGWSAMTDRSKTLTLVAACVQISLAATAWTDLARRSAEDVVGPKAMWVVVIAVSFVGPIAYFTTGRRDTRGRRHGKRCSGECVAAPGWRW